MVPVMARRHPLEQHFPNRPRNTPAKYLWTYVGVFAALTAVASVYEQQRPALETTEAPTAVGDERYFELPFVAWKRPISFLEAAGPEPPRPLFLQSEEPVNRDDAQMRKVAWPQQKYFIYRDPADPKDSARYYLKVDRGRYLVVGLEPKG